MISTGDYTEPIAINNEIITLKNRLIASEKRWNDEANRYDLADQSNKLKDMEIVKLTSKLNDQTSRTNEYKEKFDNNEKIIANFEYEKLNLLQELELNSNAYEQYKLNSAINLDKELKKSNNIITLLENDIKTLKNDLEISIKKCDESHEREINTKLELEEQLKNTEKEKNMELERENYRLKREYEVMIDQISKRLIATEERWQREADKIDAAEKSSKESENKYLTIKSEYELECINRSLIHDKLEKSVLEIVNLEKKMKSLNNEKDLLLNRHQNQELTLHSQSVEIDHLKKVEIANLEKRINYLEKNLNIAKNAEESSKQSERDAQEELSLEVEQREDLEARLEQALSRWKQEQDKCKGETDKYWKMKTLSSVLTAEKDRQKLEIESLIKRLSEYDNLPLPDEISARFQNMNEDLSKMSSSLHILNRDKDELENNFNEQNQKYNELIESHSEQDAAVESMKNEISNNKKLISSLKRDLKYLHTDQESDREKISDLEREREQLLENQTELNVKLDNLNNEYLDMKDKCEKLQGHLSLLGNLENLNEEKERESKEEKDDDDEDNDNEDENIKSSNQEGIQSIQIEQMNGQGPQILGDIDEISKIAAGNLKKIMDSNAKTKKEQAQLEKQREDFKILEKADRIRREDEDAKKKILNLQSLGKVIDIVELIKFQPKNEPMAWRGARALRDMIISDEDVRHQIVSCDGDILLIKCLKKFPESVMVQGQCMRLLGTLAFGNDQIRRRTGEKGVLKLILKAMETLIDDETVLLHACTAITNLTHNSIENRQRFLEASGIEILSETMNLLKLSSKFQKQSCWALLTISGSDDASRLVVQKGGATAAVNAMLQHSLDPGVQQFGCWALGNMALAGNDVRRKLKMAGAVDVCKVAIDNHGDNEEVLRQARSALGTLSG